MQARRETKRHIIALQTMLRSTELMVDQRANMEINMGDLRKQLNVIEGKVNKEEIKARREFVSKNKGLLDIFNAFWLTYLSFTCDGFLSHEGYTKFNHGIQIALVGHHSFDEVNNNVNADWEHDKLLFGPFNKEGFFDLLFETIETWTEIVDPTYYAAFAWSLLDSMADVSSHPPRLRPLREIKCITKVANEAAMIKAYIKTKKIRSALALEADVMSRVPEVQKRLRARKHGAELNDEQRSMVELLSKSASISTGTYIDPGGGGDSDNDSNKSPNSQKTQGIQNISVVSMRDLLSQGLDEGKEYDDDEEEETDKIIITPEVKPFPQRGRHMEKRTSTISFMEYVKARRNTRTLMNGGSLTDSLSRMSASQRAGGGVSNGSGGDLHSISSGLSESDNDSASSDSWIVNQARDSDGASLETLGNRDGIAAGSNSNGNGEFTQYADYTKYERKINKRFKQFMESGQRFSDYKGGGFGNGNGSRSTLTNGISIGGTGNGADGNKRSILNASDSYEYRAIDIDEVNRQITQRAKTFAAMCDDPRDPNYKKRSKSSYEHYEGINTVGVYKTLTARPHKIKPLTQPGGSIDNNMTNDGNNANADRSLDEYKNIIEAGGDDISSMVSDSSLLHGSSLTSKDSSASRININTDPDTETNRVYANSLLLDPSLSEHKRRSHRARTEQFISISGNAIQTRVSIVPAMYVVNRDSDRVSVGKGQNLVPLVLPPGIIHSQSTAQLQSVHTLHPILTHANSLSSVNHSTGITPKHHSIAHAPPSFETAISSKSITVDLKHQLQMQHNQSSYKSSSSELGGGPFQLDAITPSVITPLRQVKLINAENGSNYVLSPTASAAHIKVGNSDANGDDYLDIPSRVGTCQSDEMVKDGVNNSPPRSRTPSPTHIKRGVSPFRMLQRETLSPTELLLDVKYSTTFPHGKYSDVVTTAQNMRTQPINSALPSWDHNRATKTLKLNPAPMLNQVALYVVSQPMTVKDNKKVMRELKNTVSLHAVNTLSRNNSIESNYSISAGEMPTIAMQALTQKSAHTHDGKSKSAGQMPVNTTAFNPHNTDHQDQGQYYSGTNSIGKYDPHNISDECSSKADSVSNFLLATFDYKTRGSYDSNDNYYHNSTQPGSGSPQQYGDAVRMSPEQAVQYYSGPSPVHNQSVNYTDIQGGRSLLLDGQVTDSLIETFKDALSTHNATSVASHAAQINSLGNWNMNSDTSVDGAAVSLNRLRAGQSLNAGCNSNLNEASIQSVMSINNRSSPNIIDDLNIISNFEDNVLISTCLSQANSLYSIVTPQNVPDMTISPVLKVTRGGKHDNTKSVVSVNSQTLPVSSVNDTKQKNESSGTVVNKIMIRSASFNNDTNEILVTDPEVAEINSGIDQGEVKNVSSTSAVLSNPGDNTANGKGVFVTSAENAGAAAVTQLLQNSVSSRKGGSNNSPPRSPKNRSKVLSRPQSPSDSFNRIPQVALQIPNTNVVSSSSHTDFLTVQGSSQKPASPKQRAIKQAIYNTTAVENSNILTAVRGRQKEKMLNKVSHLIRNNSQLTEISASGKEITNPNFIYGTLDTNSTEQLDPMGRVVDPLKSAHAVIPHVKGVHIVPVTEHASMTVDKLNNTEHLKLWNKLQTPNMSTSSSIMSSNNSTGGGSINSSIHSTTGGVSGVFDSQKVQFTLPAQSSMINNNIPWIPRGTLLPLDHNRSNHITGWREKNDIMKKYPFDSSKAVMTIKSQNAVRSSFESYVKQKHRK